MRSLLQIKCKATFRTMWLVGILLIGLTLIGFPRELLAACNWEANKIAALPDWYNSNKATGIIRPAIDTMENFKIYQYELTSEKYIVIKIPAISDDSSEQYYDGEMGYLSKMYFIEKGDTLQIDSSQFGFNSPVFVKSNDTIYYQNLIDMNEDYARGDIVCFDIRNRRRGILHAGAGITEIALSSDETYLAYSDFGDAYIYSIPISAEKNILGKGGSFDIGSQCPSQSSRCREFRWARDRSSLIFKYYPVIYNDKFDLYRLDLPPN